MIKTSQRDPATAVYHATVQAGDYWLHRLEAGQTLRITDLEGNQAADTLFYNADDTAERYSMSDTLRGQGNVFLSTGSVLRSNEDRPMLEIVADTCGRHDTLGGACATESNTVRYDLEKRHMHACRDSWMLAVAQHPEYQLTKRDITHNINFFYERAGHTGRWAHLCRRYLRTGKIRGNGSENERTGADLQLSAVEQPLQWLQPHTCRYRYLVNRATRHTSGTVTRGTTRNTRPE
ncbi:hypothetical protein DZS_03170 [Dickeya ananatis]